MESCEVALTALTMTSDIFVSTKQRIYSSLEVIESILNAMAHKRLTVSSCLALAITVSVERSGDVFKMRPRSLPDCSTEMLSYIYWESNETLVNSAKQKALTC